MVIFDVERLNPEWTIGEFPGTKYGLSDNGWINSDLFEAWLCEHFVPHEVSARPLLLILDGHSTHYQPKLLRLAKEYDIIMLCLPPHTTREAQPLDCGVFGPLKFHWANVCHTYLQQNPGRVITRFQFSALFSQAWSAAVTPMNIAAGFRTYGIYPFNPSAINVSDGIVSSDITPAGATNDGRNSPLGESESFTAEQEHLFRKRHEEGFDVFTDREYVRWLKVNHPQSLPVANDDLSLSDYFSSVPVAVELPVGLSTTINHSPSGASAPGPSHSSTTVSSGATNQSLSPTALTPSAGDTSTALTPSAGDTSTALTPSAGDTSTALAADTPTTLPPSAAYKRHLQSVAGPSCSSSSGMLGECSISKYLTLPPTPKTTLPKNIPRARLLTSSDALAQLEEKEKKKKAALEEKERKKTEREQKKWQREEEQKRKAEERQRKAKTKANKAKEAAERKKDIERRAGKRKVSNATVVSMPSKKRACKLSSLESNNSVIDVNTCCICGVLYSDDRTGKDWIECECGRWLHEDCAEDCILDSNGKERFCPMCL